MVSSSIRASSCLARAAPVRAQARFSSASAARASFTSRAKKARWSSIHGARVSSASHTAQAVAARNMQAATNQETA